MAVKHKSTCDGWIAEIETSLEAMVGMTRALPERNLNRVAQVLIGNGLSIHFQHFEMDLVDVEGMGLKSVIFHSPVFHCTNVGGDYGLFIGFKHLLLLSVHCDIELDGAVGTAKFFREVKFSLGRGFLFFQVCKLDALHRSLGCG